MLRNGVCQNTTSGPGESRHKVACKQPAKNTQRIADLFEGQLGNQYADNVVIDRTMVEISKNVNERPSQSHTDNEPIFQSKRFFYEDKYIYDMSKKHIGGSFQKSDQWFDKKLLADVETFIEEVIAPSLPKGRIYLYTMCKQNNVIYRASPLYKNKRGWNDWANIDCDDDGIVPAQFVLFVEIKGLTKPIVRNKVEICDTDGIYAIAHSLPLPLSAKPIQAHWGDNHKAHQASCLFEYSQKCLQPGNKRRPTLFLIDPTLIVSPCIAVPDLDAADIDIHSYIFLKSKCDWQTIFIDHMRDELGIDEESSKSAVHSDSSECDDSNSNE